MDKPIREYFKFKKIEWERIFLNIVIEADSEAEPEFYLIHFRPNDKSGGKVRTGRKLKLYYCRGDSNEYVLRFNIAAIDGREFLENGIWEIMVSNGKDWFKVILPYELGYELEKLSRIFRYGNGKYAYNISFSAESEDGKNLKLCIYSCFMIENKKWRKRKYIQEGFSAMEKIKKACVYIAVICIRSLYHIIALTIPKNGNKVLFMTERKPYLSGNLKYIDDRIRERNLNNVFKISYLCRKSAGSEVSIVRWIKMVFVIARQNYIFIDDYSPVFGLFKLSGKTKLIQVWHAGEGFKSVGYSRFGKTGSPFPMNSCHKAYDYALTGSNSLIEVYEEVFGIEKNAFFAVGMPRLDDFLDERKIAEFKTTFFKTYPMLKNKKIILFAPTFRGVGQKDAYYNYEMVDLEQLYHFCDDEYAVLIKMHPFVKENIKIPHELKDRIYDFKNYKDINELYYVTDILITDYSSNYYEFALMRKPVIFYTYDREIYELTRGVHRSVKKYAPGKICDSFEELMDTLKNEDYEIDKLYKFIDNNFGEYDGHACDKVIDKILIGNKGI